MKNQESIELKRLEYLYENILASTIGYGVIICFIYYVFYPLAQATALNIWFLLSFIIVVLRYATYKHYKKKAPLGAEDLHQFFKLYTVYILISGALLGSFTIFVMPDIIFYHIILVLFIGGLCLGAAVSLATKVNLIYAYILLSLSPLAFHFLQSDVEASGTLFIVLVFFMAFIIVITKNNAKTVQHNFEISIENNALVEKLEHNILELNQVNKAKSDFLSMMSHEIRTPLNAIIGFIKLLKDKEEDTTKLQYLTTVDKSSFLLLNVINDILDINKIDANKLSLEAITFNPQEEFEHLFSLFSQIAKEQKVNFISNIEDDLPPYLSGDIHRLKQISSNLLSNAIKFTPKYNHVYFNVTYVKDTSSLHIEVKDEGIGILSENISKLTQEYTQASDSVSREYGGTGLGLSIVKKLLNLMGTSLEIQSELGKGSVFSCTIVLPIAEKTPDEESTLDTLVYLEDKRVLVAEDNKTNQMLIQLILQDYGLDITLKDDGIEAEEAFKNEDFDLVLMDINMPHQNGTETMKAIKLYEESKEIKTPIVALTANAVSGDKERYLAFGFDDYLTKPINNEALQKVLVKYLT